MSSTVFTAYENALEGASITCSRALESLGPDRLQIDQVGKRMRVAGITAGSPIIDVDIDFDPNNIGRRVDISCVAWLRPRFAPMVERAGMVEGLGLNDPVRHFFSAVQIGDGELYDSGWVPADIAPGYGYHIHRPDPAADGSFQTVLGVRWARFRFDASARVTAPYDFVDWGWAGYFQRTDYRVGFAAPFRYAVNSGGETLRPRRSPAAFPEETGARWRTWGAPFRTLPGDEMGDVEQMLWDVADTGHILFCRDHNDPGRQTIRGLIDSPSYDQTARQLASWPLTINESF